MSNYSSTYPSVSPTYQIDFANGGRIPPNATFSRADSPIDATKAAASAVHYWSNEKHLSSENLVTQSTPDDNWSRNFLSPTYSQTGPYTGANATLLTEVASAGNSYYASSPNFPITSGTTYTYSVWVKKQSGTREYLQLRPGGIGAGKAYTTFHLSGAGSVDQTGGSIFDSSSITAGPTGWYKLVLTLTSDVNDSATSLSLAVAASGGGELPSIVGDTGNSFLIFGAQVSTSGETVLNETSGQIHREYAPTLKSPATAGAARFEHDPETNVSLGCLIEGQSTNELLYSANFDETYWFKTNATVTRNAAISPSGELAADLVVANSIGSATTRHIGKGSFSFTSGTTYTLSVYAKAAGSTKFYLRAGNPAIWGASSEFTLTGSGSAANTSGSAQIQPCGNGWFRLSVTETASSTGSTNLLLSLADSSGNLTFIGDDYSGVLLWGAQMEEGTLSSYISTLLSARTRAADSLSVATADIGYTGGPVTLTADYDMVDPTANVAAQNILLLSDGSSSNRVLLYNRSGKSGGYVASADGSTTASGNPSSTAAGAHKLCVVADTNNYIMSFDGTSSTDTAAVLPSGLNQIDIGSGSFSGHVSRVSLFGTAISETAANALTS